MRRMTFLDLCSGIGIFRVGNAVMATVAYAVAMSLPESREPDIF